MRVAWVGHCTNASCLLLLPLLDESPVKAYPLFNFFSPIKSAEVLTFQRLWDSKCCTQHRALFSPAFDFYAHFKLVREYTGVLFRLGSGVLAFKLPAFPGLLPIKYLLIKVLTKERNTFSLVLDFQTRLALLNGKTNKCKPCPEIP